MDAAEARFLHLLRRLRRLGPGEPPFERVGISGAQLALLERVQAEPGCSVHELAASLGLTPPTVSVGVRRLEEAGLLQRLADPHDRRVCRLSVTGRGAALCERVQRFRREKTRRLLAGLTSDERAVLLDLLERALDAAEGTSNVPPHEGA